MRKLNTQTDFFSTAGIYSVLIVAGLVLPALLLPLVKITGYSEVVEEVAKVLVVLFLLLKLPTHKARIFAGVILGFLFGLSESIFYLNNIFQIGDFSLFWQRFLWTVPMHISTVLLMVFAGLAGKKFLIFGLFGAVVLHLLFNTIVVHFF